MSLCNIPFVTHPILIVSYFIIHSLRVQKLWKSKTATFQVFTMYSVCVVVHSFKNPPLLNWSIKNVCFRLKFISLPYNREKNVSSPCCIAHLLRVIFSATWCWKYWNNFGHAGRKQCNFFRYMEKYTWAPLKLLSS